jgi:hypothetical protein
MGRLPTAYIYDNKSGSISYTINDVTGPQRQSLMAKGLDFYCDPVQYNIAGAYVTKDEATGNPTGVAVRRDMAPIVHVDKQIIVANGTDSATVSNLVPGTTVTTDGFSFVSNSTVDFVEFSANGFSTVQDENLIKVNLSTYGYYSYGFIIQLAPGELL